MTLLLFFREQLGRRVNVSVSAISYCLLSVLIYVPWIEYVWFIREIARNRLLVMLFLIYMCAKYDSCLDSCSFIDKFQIGRQSDREKWNSLIVTFLGEAKIQPVSIAITAMNWNEPSVTICVHVLIDVLNLRLQDYIHWNSIDFSVRSPKNIWMKVYTPFVSMSKSRPIWLKS